MSRFLREPPSIRHASGTIVTATLMVVLGAGALMRVVDPHEYSSIWVGMWWAVQTVTTVGYGDVAPKNVTGRIVAASVMLEGIAFVAIVTAAITSTFVARAARGIAGTQAHEERAAAARIEARLDVLERKLDGIAATLRSPEDI
jgi:voltage-gated potassium channel Kch